MEKRQTSANGQLQSLLCCFILLTTIVLVAVVCGFLGGLYLYNKIIEIGIEAETEIGRLKADNALLRNQLNQVSWSELF